MYIPQANDRNHRLAIEVDQERKKEAAEDAAKAAGKVALRFGVGHRVLANIGKYSAGVVIKLWDQGTCSAQMSTRMHCVALRFLFCAYKFLLELEVVGIYIYIYLYISIYYTC